MKETIKYDKQTSVAAVTREVDIAQLLFGKQLHDVGGINVLKHLLKRNQREFLDRVVEIVLTGLVDGSIEYYDGLVSRRWLAERLDMEGSNFRQKLQRISDKADKLHRHESN